MRIKKWNSYKEIFTVFILAIILTMSIIFGNAQPIEMMTVKADSIVAKELISTSTDTVVTGGKSNSYQGHAYTRTGLTIEGDKNYTATINGIMSGETRIDFNWLGVDPSPGYSSLVNYDNHGAGHMIFRVASAGDPSKYFDLEFYNVAYGGWIVGAVVKYKNEIRGTTKTAPYNTVFQTRDETNAVSVNGKFAGMFYGGTTWVTFRMDDDIFEVATERAYGGGADHIIARFDGTSEVKGGTESGERNNSYGLPKLTGFDEYTISIISEYKNGTDICIQKITTGGQATTLTGATLSSEPEFYTRWKNQLFVRTEKVLENYNYNSKEFEVPKIFAYSYTNSTPFYFENDKVVSSSYTAQISKNGGAFESVAIGAKLDLKPAQYQIKYISNEDQNEKYYFDFEVFKGKQAPLTVKSTVNGHEVVYGSNNNTYVLSVVGGSVTGGEVEYYADGQVTIENNILKVHGTGTVSVYAVLEGGADYEDAVSEKLVFTVKKAIQSDFNISITGLESDTLIYDPTNNVFMLRAAGGITHGEVAYSIVSGNAKIEGAILTILSPGQVIISATLEGDNRYEEVSNKQIYLNVIEDDGMRTLTFESNGGSEVQAINTLVYNAIAQPENPTREGYSFAGWYLDKDFTKEFKFASGIEVNTVVYAKWVEETTESSGCGSVVDMQSVALFSMIVVAFVIARKAKKESNF